MWLSEVWPALVGILCCVMTSSALQVHIRPFKCMAHGHRPGRNGTAQALVLARQIKVRGSANAGAGYLSIKFGSQRAMRWAE